MYWTPEHLANTRDRAIENFHAYERRVYPLRMWKALYRKIRYYNIVFEYAPNSHSLILYLSDETMQYPKVGNGMSKAISDIEYCFTNDIL